MKVPVTISRVYKETEKACGPHLLTIFFVVAANVDSGRRCPHGSYTPAVDTSHVSQFDPLPVTVPSKSTEKLAATRPWLQCTKLFRLATSAPALTTSHITIDPPSSLHIKDVFCGVHASSFHSACNGMSWTSFAVRTAVSCARRNSLAAVCGVRILTTTSSPVSPRAATAISTVTRHWRVLVGGVDEVAR